MMKSCEIIIVVDVVEDAVKFYTEKLGFDIVDLLAGKNGEARLQLVTLRKGKCFIKFRTPFVEELADFSFIKRCSSRCVTVQAEMKKGLDKYFVRCQKKGVKVAGEPKDNPEFGVRTFSVRDPFGVKLVFSQALEGARTHRPEEVMICGMVVTKAQAKDLAVFDQAVLHLKEFGVLRRSAKKFIKLKLKEISK